MSLLQDNAIFRNVYCWLAGNPGNSAACGGRDGLLPAGGEWFAYFVAGFTIMLILVNGVMVFATFYTYMERRVLGRFQSRIGPNRVGPFGLLQPIADAVKLLTKEDIVPNGADRIVFTLAPVVMFVPVLLIMAVVPFGKSSFLADLNIGVLYIIAVSTVTTLAMFMAGWASANRYAMFGSMRAVAQLISYEVPVVLSMVGVLLIVGSLSLVKIVDAQLIPFILVQPLGFFVFIVGISAEMNRSPFDLVEAESEIVAGYHTEYSGMKFGLFQLAEFASVLVWGGVMAVLFLGGWRWVPGYLSHLLFVVEVFFFAFILIWVRATIPRLRIDQIMGLAWKFLFPLSLINLFVTAVEVYLLKDAAGRISTGDMWLMALVNLAVAAVSIAALARLTGQPTSRYAPAALQASVPAAREAR